MRYSAAPPIGPTRRSRLWPAHRRCAPCGAEIARGCGGLRRARKASRSCLAMPLRFSALPNSPWASKTSGSFAAGVQVEWDGLCVHGCRRFLRDGVWLRPERVLRPGGPVAPFAPLRELAVPSWYQSSVALLSEQSPSWLPGRLVGLEKESPHEHRRCDFAARSPRGAVGAHAPHVTTDFGEAMLEFVTPLARRRNRPGVHARSAQLHCPGSCKTRACGRRACRVCSPGEECSDWRTATATSR